MTTVKITVESLDDVKRSMKAAFAGHKQGHIISFVSHELLWDALAPNRLAIVQALMGAGPITLREVARRVQRDVRAVHSDVHKLLNSGVLDKTDDGRIEFPYDAIHMDVLIEAPGITTGSRTGHRARRAALPNAA